MDTVSHGLWSFVLWHALPYPWLAVLFGMLPDLVAISPVFFYHAVRKRHRLAVMCDDECIPAGLKRYKTVAFHYTHSLVVAGAVIGAVTLVWGFQWWIFAWPLHIVIDIFTHPREKATPFLWPLLGTRVHGLKWWGAHFLVLNGALLLAAYFRFVR